MITQEQAEAMVYEHLKMDYSDRAIKEMPYVVKVSLSPPTVRVIGEGWCDIYKVEYVPRLFLIGH